MKKVTTMETDPVVWNANRAREHVGSILKIASTAPRIPGLEVSCKEILALLISIEQSWRANENNG